MSSRNKYFKDEMTFLNELGKEFGAANPDLAPFLGDRGNDPDVERLLQGFAFLTGRLREKLDDELQEVTHGLMSLLWPHYLRPIPSMAILQFTPHVGLTETKNIQSRLLPPRDSIKEELRGVTVESLPVDGTRCQFRTCYDVELTPLKIDQVRNTRKSGVSQVSIKLSLDPRAQLDKLGVRRLRFYLHGEDYIVSQFYLWLFRYLSDITISAEIDSTKRISLGVGALQPVGFAKEHAILPYPENSFDGYRLLQEYFAFPEKFRFFDITGLDRLLELGADSSFAIHLDFNRPLDEQTRIEKRHFALHCTPIVNLMAMDAKPVRLAAERTEYRLMPESPNPSHYQIFSVDRVSARVPGTSKERIYSRFESFGHAMAEHSGERLYCTLRLKPSVVTEGVDTYVSFVNARQETQQPEAEIVSVNLFCSNGELTHQLKVGDIRRPTGDSPEYADFQNITQPTLAIPPPLDGSLQWDLISNFALNYLSITNVEVLRDMLAVYDFQAIHDRNAERKLKLRMEGVEEIKASEVTRLFGNLPIRGRRIELSLREKKFGTEGEMFLFASVLSEFFALYSSINSFSQLVVQAVESREIYKWPAKSGTQRIV